MPLNKTFVVTMFGEPFSWINQFIEQVQCLEPHGWNWMIFTPAKIESKGNVKIIPLTTEDFNDLCESKTGVRPNFSITSKGTPSVHITDYYVASGLIFEDYLQGVDYWGIANLDIVFGRLDHFLPDSELEKFDIWTDDPRSFNGIFSLFSNNLASRNVFRLIPDWQDKFAQPPCRRCTEGIGQHTLFGTDEFDMSKIIKGLPFGSPRYYPIHSHDRLEQHVPNPKLEIKDDGSLYELFKDINGPQWIHAYPLMGREIPYFHFPRLKKWPL